MMSISLRAYVTEGHEWAAAFFSDSDDNAEISVSNGGTFRISAQCSKLLYHALHEIHGTGHREEFRRAVL